MSDWDAIFGEAALGLDLAKAELVRSGAGHASAGGGQRSAVLTRPDPPRDDRPAELSAATSGVAIASPGTRPLPAAQPSRQLTSQFVAPTAGREAIFRQEALEFRARGRDTAGGAVRLGARWKQWAFRLTLVLLVAAVAGMWVIHTDESTSGPAVVDGRTGMVAALLPAVVGPDLPRSRRLTVALPGGRSVRVSGLHARLADATAIRRAGLTPLTQPAILVTGRLDPGASAASVAPDAHLQTQVSVVLRSESLADVLARQFGAMLGHRRATP
jgi:hypothetical protein